jgi:hypothetical protein
MCCPDNRANLKRDQSDKGQEPDCEHPDRHTYRGGT